MTETNTRQEFGGLKDVISRKFDSPVSWIDQGMGNPCSLVLTSATIIQARDVNDDGSMGDLKFWPSGDPLDIAVLTGTDTATGESRSIFIQGVELTRAFGKAVQDAGVSVPAAGDLLTVTWSGEHTTENTRTKAKLSPTKEFAVTLVIAE